MSVGEKQPGCFGHFGFGSGVRPRVKLYCTLECPFNTECAMDTGREVMFDTQGEFLAIYRANFDSGRAMWERRN